jgi:hypothetical protein
VTFDLDGGNIGGVTTNPAHPLASDTEVGTANMPATPTRAGIGFPGNFIFTGWALTSGGDPAFDYDTVVEATKTVFARWMIPVPEVVITDPGGGEITFPNPDGPNPPSPDPGQVTVTPPGDDGSIIITIPPPPGGDHMFPPGDVTVTAPPGFVVDDENPAYVDDNGNLVVVIMEPQAIFNLNGGHIGGDWRHSVHPITYGYAIGDIISIPVPRNTAHFFQGWRLVYLDGSLSELMNADEVAQFVMAAPEVLPARRMFVAIWNVNDGERGSMIGGGGAGGGFGGGGVGVGGAVVGTGGVGVGGAVVGDGDDTDRDDTDGADADFGHVNYNPPTGGVSSTVHDNMNVESSSAGWLVSSLIALMAILFGTSKKTAKQAD